MPDFQLPLSPTEREYLTRILDVKLGETRVEEHRTHSPGYRDQVKQEEQMLRGLLKKLGQAKK